MSLLQPPDLEHMSLDPTFKAWVEALCRQVAALNAQVAGLNAQVAQLTADNSALRAENEHLRQRLSDFEATAALNSSNSSKPPSTDRQKIPNNREKTGRKQGAQPAHEGHTLKMVEQPDEIIVHKVDGICDCGQDLEPLAPQRSRKTQVFDLPETLGLRVTEHQSEVKTCTCGRVHTAELISQAPAIYGHRIRAMLVYLSQAQFIPMDRLQQVCLDLFGCTISDGVIYQTLAHAHTDLEAVEAHIVQQLLLSPSLHVDETSLRACVAGAAEGTPSKNHYVHLVSNDEWTLYGFHVSRGIQAVEAMQVLPNYTGILIHDRYAMYWRYGNDHGLCNAHLLRELRFLEQECNLAWAGKMRRLLLSCHRAREAAQAVAPDYLIQYQRILDEALRRHPHRKQHNIIFRSLSERKAYLLMQALDEHRASVLRFITDEHVAFDNNLAERDLRMIKLRQKISGCFRSVRSAVHFCRMRSYLSSARKQAHNVFEAILQLVQGKPLWGTPATSNS